MSDQPLIVRDDAKLTVAWTPAAIELKENALALSGLVGRVSNAEENAAAVDAAAGIAFALKQCESTRKACKEPILEFGRKIDDAAKAFRAELEVEQLRVNRLIGDFQQLELAKVRAAEAARNAELREIERRREEELAKAKSHEHREAIQARAEQEVASVAPPVEAVRAEGQVVVEEIVIERVNEFELMKARPDLVRKVEFDMVALKAILKSGQKLPGVTFRKEIKNRVRAGRGPLTLEVV